MDRELSQSGNLPVVVLTNAPEPEAVVTAVREALNGVEVLLARNVEEVMSLAEEGGGISTLVLDTPNQHPLWENQIDTALDSGRIDPEVPIAYMETQETVRDSIAAAVEAVDVIRTDKIRRFSALAKKINQAFQEVLWSLSFVQNNSQENNPEHYNDIETALASAIEMEEAVMVLEARWSELGNEEFRKIANHDIAIKLKVLVEQYIGPLVEEFQKREDLAAWKRIESCKNLYLDVLRNVLDACEEKVKWNDLEITKEVPDSSGGDSVVKHKRIPGLVLPEKYSDWNFCVIEDTESERRDAEQAIKKAGGQAVFAKDARSLMFSF